MNKEDITIALHGDESLEGGRYNVLASFSNGLLKGFNKIGVKAHTLKYCVENSINPSAVMGFNVTGHPTWQSVMDAGLPNIMWSVDSIFAHNFEVLENYAQNPNFILFSVTSSDSAPLNEYFPNLKHAYFPHATDLDLWKKQDVEKDLDIVLFSSIEDYEKQLEDLKISTPKEVYGLLMEFYEVMQENPILPFWEIYQIFKKHKGINLDVYQYLYIFRTLSYIIMNEKKAKTIQALSGFNVKVFGEGPWEKYISGKVEHMGSCNLLESIDVMNRAKIAIHPHAMQLSMSLHERPLNASAVETFVLCSKSGVLQAEFAGAMGFYNDANFEDIAQMAEHFLKNEDERTQMAKKANQITAERHTWEQRAQSVLSLF